MFSSTSSVSLVRFIPDVFSPVSTLPYYPVYLSPQFLSVICLLIDDSSCVNSVGFSESPTKLDGLYLGLFPVC